ncbi:hypothetical protein SBA2_680021 [Acidobacteriia bacterium SbA2]|nr:hypothetical protein SBA2_680021 [Acidobacteriia bacterium SbA2]
MEGAALVAAVCHQYDEGNRWHREAILTAALSFGERVSHSGAFISRSGTGEGFLPSFCAAARALRVQVECITGCGL